MKIKETKTQSKTVIVDNSAETDRASVIEAYVQVDGGRVNQIYSGTVTDAENQMQIATFSESAGTLSTSHYRTENRAQTLQEIEDFISAVKTKYNN